MNRYHSCIRPPVMLRRYSYQHQPLSVHTTKHRTLQSTYVICVQKQHTLMMFAFRPVFFSVAATSLYSEEPTGRRKVLTRSSFMSSHSDGRAAAKMIILNTQIKLLVTCIYVFTFIFSFIVLHSTLITPYLFLCTILQTQTRRLTLDVSSM